MTLASESQIRRLAVSQISQPEAADLLSKLLTERVPLSAFFVSRSGARVSLPGFVDSITHDNGLAISVSGPPIDALRGYINFFPFDRDCEFWYGEKRELPEDLRPRLTTRGESALMFLLPDSGERLALFFTL
jgi:hypothetical protein